MLIKVITKPQTYFALLIFLLTGCVGKDKSSTELAVPSAVQYKWHEQERIMFVCLDPATWQGREYDNHSIPLDRINPTKLNTDQWCEAALSWGAKEILFVAKHTGGFCWWQTETSDYGIKNTPYKWGRGDVLLELSNSCRKYGLNLGIYVYPGDDLWGAGIGSGGQTSDPSKQEAYNIVFRKQLTEVLTNYGEILEVWFDGSCKIYIDDILEEHAANSVIFQGPQASLRWPGTESGKLFYPAWNTLKKEDLLTGVATQIHGDPDGDAWAPLETNTTLYDHFWFWSPEKEEKRKSLDQLMECYYKSVGYGSVFLLNSTPDTTGLIPEKDLALYRRFGREIERRFSHPTGEISWRKGNEFVLDLRGGQKINHTIIMEDYRQGHRIRSYSIEGWIDGQWQELCSGQSVGRMKIDYFPEITLSKLRLVVKENVNKPLLRSLSAHYVDDFVPPPKQAISPWSDWRDIQDWETADVHDLKLDLTIDLSAMINLPGQYSVAIKTLNEDVELEVTEAVIYYEGKKALNEFVTIKGNSLNINRTAMVTNESSSVLHVSLKCNEPCSGKVQFRPAIIYQ